MLFPIAMLGPNSMLVMVGVMILLFGGSKIPELMRGVGTGMREFKEGLQELDSTVREETPLRTAQTGETSASATLPQ